MQERMEQMQEQQRKMKKCNRRAVVEETGTPFGFLNDGPSVAFLSFFAVVLHLFHPFLPFGFSLWLFGGSVPFWTNIYHGQ